VGLVVLGHSLGGLIALDHVIRRPGAFAAVVVTSPFIGPAIAVSRLERAVGNVLSRVAPRLRLDARIESRWLSHDPAVADAYARDARVLRRLTLRLWHEIEIAQRQVRARAAEIEQPALFLVGGDDHVVDTAPTYEVFRRLGSADKRLLTYAGYFHEILNEVGKGIVLGDLRHWLDEHFAP
jgi:alpha-beta hydrolase superfamily lysophospholipase